jgi:hypothetical protein
MDHDIENQYLKKEEFVCRILNQEDHDNFIPVKPEHRWVIRGDIENQGAGFKVVKLVKSPNEDKSKARFFSNDAWNKC